jgi:hypothetical protein
MLRAWLERQARIADGSGEHMADRIGYARPDSAALETIKENVGQFTPAVHRALPKPRTR